MEPSKIMVNNSNLLAELQENDTDDFYSIMCVSGLFGVIQYQEMYYNKRPKRTSALTGHNYVIELMNGHAGRCFDMLRMEPPVLQELCEQLKEKTGLKDSRYVTALEQLAIFLLVLSHNESNRVVAERFQHSGETISKYFNLVLKKVCRLGVQIIRPPEQSIVPPEIRHNPKYWPFFKV